MNKAIALQNFNDAIQDMIKAGFDVSVVELVDYDGRRKYNHRPAVIIKGPRTAGDKIVMSDSSLTDTG